MQKIMNNNTKKILLFTLLLSVSLCDYCDINCEKCIDEDQCETCVPDLQRKLNDQKKCVCEEGFKENVRLVCESTNQYINILLLVFCIISILVFIYFILRMDKINPLDFCTMLIFKHRPINDRHRQLHPIGEQSVQHHNNLTTLQNTDQQLATTQKDLLVKEGDEEDRSQAMKSMQDFIGPEISEKDNKPQTPEQEESKSGVIGGDSEEENKEDEEEEEGSEEESEEESEEDDDDISFGDDDDKEKIDEDNDENYNFEDDDGSSQAQSNMQSQVISQKKSVSKEKTVSDINVEDLESQSVQLKSIRSQKSMKSSKRTDRKESSKGDEVSEIDLGQSSVMQKSQTNNKLLSGGNTMVIQDNNFDDFEVDDDEDD